ncbi:MAG: purine-nucleoside phosphorylase [Mycoplasmatota bacterium]|nr:purine-nucleoside phosphorylase [Mycoplasmatota bacterium]
MSIHIESKKEDIADVVIMSGDPLRAKYIAEHFLDEYKMVNDVRNMYGFTGYYKGRRVTIFSHGMGIPSIGIYAYELYKFYDVKKIIRVGTCGTINRDVKLMDVLLATTAYSVSTFPLLFDGDRDKEYAASKNLNEDILETAKRLEIPVTAGKIITSDVFDPYVDGEKFASCFPNDNYIGSEMESFGLFYLAYKLKREAACLLTVVDAKFDKKSLSSEERQSGLNDMITIALESLL